MHRPLHPSRQKPTATADHHAPHVNGMNSKRRHLEASQPKSSRRRCSALPSQPPLSAHALLILTLRSRLHARLLPSLASDSNHPGYIPPPHPNTPSFCCPLALDHVRRVCGVGFLLHTIRRLTCAPVALQRSRSTPGVHPPHCTPAMFLSQSIRASSKQASSVTSRSQALLITSCQGLCILGRVTSVHAAATPEAQFHQARRPPSPSSYVHVHMLQGLCYCSCGQQAAARERFELAVSKGPSLFPSSVPPVFTLLISGHPRAHAALSWVIMSSGDGGLSVVMRRRDEHLRAMQVAEDGVRLKCPHSRCHRVCHRFVGT